MGGLCISDQPVSTEDMRESLCNEREEGAITKVSLPEDRITSLHGIVFDIDVDLYQESRLIPQPNVSAQVFFEQTLATWLANDPVLTNAEVRYTGRNLHVLLWFDIPLEFQADCDRERWSAIVQVVQTALPIDPNQPGITALTRPIGSRNSKTHQQVAELKSPTPVTIDNVLSLYDRMCRAPFRTVFRILNGDDRCEPCPLCEAQNSQFSALDRVGQCYAKCGRVDLANLFHLLLKPRSDREEGDHGQHPR